MGALIVTLLAATALAGEAEDARARELYENGAILYEEGRYEDAVVAFEEAYRLSARPALLFNIANALERAGRWGEALDVLSRYRAYASAEERATLDRRITNLERRIAEAKAVAPPPPPAEPEPEAPVAPVVVSTPPPSAEPNAWLRPLPLAVGGVGVVALGAAGALGAASVDAHTRAASGCAEDGGGILRCDGAAAGALADEAGTALAADVLWVVGAVGVGTGVGLLLFGEGGVVAAGPGYVMVEARF